MGGFYVLLFISNKEGYALILQNVQNALDLGGGGAEIG